MRKQKKILMLGGLRYLLPVIQAAHELGHYVITCDYLPHNIAHRYSDEYHNVSIIDKEAVLELARKLEIDGIMSFAVDPGVITAAYVAEKMNLPGNPYKSVKILQNKVLFRQFLADNGFTVPKSKGYRTFEAASADSGYFEWPVVVKPVDSAGSKGVTKVEDKCLLAKAFIHALDNSISKEVIIEEFIETEGFSSDSDAFSVNGELKFMSFSDQRFDIKAINPYTPSGFSWPSTMPRHQQKVLTEEVQRLLNLLNMRTSVYNVEARIGKNGKTYIMEVSPRGGGNRLCEVLRYASGVDLIKNAVRSAVNEKVVDVNMPCYNGFWAEIILHSNKSGVFREVNVSPLVMKHLVELDLWINKGDQVHAFKGANESIGTLILRFDSKEELDDTMDNSHKYINVIIE